MNRFTLNPTSIDISRSIFDRNCNLKTSFDMGKLIPIYIDEVLPGDTISMDMAEVIRMGTPIAPIMDDLYAKISWFFVPYRLIWSHWQQFCGENDETAWTLKKEYTMPTISGDKAVSYFGPGPVAGSLADYFGLPVVQGGTGNSKYLGDICELPFRAYYKVWNDWFRDENNQAPVLFSIGDEAASYKWEGLSVYPGVKDDLSGGYRSGCMPVAKEHDLFTSALPSPQKGEAVNLNLGLDYGLPLKVDPTDLHDMGGTLVFGNASSKTGFYPLGVNFGSAGSSYGNVQLASAASGTGSFGINQTNLVADLSSLTVNNLRLAFQTQKFLEKNARGGTRYVEFIKNHFNVTSPDARLQRSEILAEFTVNIQVDQVLSTTNNVEAGKTANNLLGTTGAYSKTVGSGSQFTYSAVEHGYLMGFILIRQKHTYSQGIPKLFLKKNLLDHYFPVFANIGEQPISNKELFVDFTEAGSSKNDETFGFQEAWYEYRYKPSRVSGMLNPAASNSLDYWTLTDKFAKTPVLGSDFIRETKDNLTRALAAGTSTYQFIADIYFKGRWSRPMPVYSVPGLLDHH